MRNPGFNYAKTTLIGRFGDPTVGPHGQEFQGDYTDIQAQAALIACAIPAEGLDYQSLQLQVEWTGAFAAINEAVLVIYYRAAGSWQTYGRWPLKQIDDTCSLADKATYGYVSENAYPSGADAFALGVENYGAGTFWITLIAKA